VRIVDVSMEV